MAGQTPILATFLHCMGSQRMAHPLGAASEGTEGNLGYELPWWPSVVLRCPTGGQTMIRKISSSTAPNMRLRLEGSSIIDSLPPAPSCN